ncbi:MAG TPA: hypothetical protein VFZ48_04070 [Candidatus Saccharimonadales bacterium]
MKTFSTPLLALAVLFGAIFALLSPVEVRAAQCGTIQTSFDFNCANVDPKAGDQRNPIFHILLVVINFLSLGVAVIVTGFIVWGGFTYGTSNGEPAKAQKGISYITNAVLALILYMGLYAIINYLVPGGIFT